MINKYEPKISVIVPVYNVAKYLPQCLDSLILQTYHNLEIICINDGSKDNSLEILEAYALKDNRIKIVNQENKGLSATRNRGVEEATGEWISFIDSDDWVALSLYQKFVDDIKKCNQTIDMYMFNGFHFGAIEGKQFNCVMQFWDMRYWNNFQRTPPVFSFSDCINPFKGIIASYLKIYRADWYKENNFKFTEGIIFEDILFNIQTGLKAKNLYLNNDWLYYYRENMFSILRTLHRNVFDIFKILELVKQEFLQNDLYEQKKYLLFAEQYFQLSEKLKSCPSELKKEFVLKARDMLKQTSTDLDETVYRKFADIQRFDYLMNMDV